MDSSTFKPYSLKKLSSFVGDDPQQVVEMIRLFIETIPPEIDLLIKCAAANSMVEVATVAHRIKPSVDVFDLQQSMKAIRMIELFCKDTEKHSEVAGLVSNLAQNLLSALDIMKNELGESY